MCIVLSEEGVWGDVGGRCVMSEESVWCDVRKVCVYVCVMLGTCVVCC